MIRVKKPASAEFFDAGIPVTSVLAKDGHTGEIMKRDWELIRDRLASIGRSFCQWHKREWDAFLLFLQASPGT
jgi:hypothetical protein